MGHLMAIRDRQISNEQHFQPLKSTSELLKTYGQQLPESVYTQLEVGSGAQMHTFLWVLTHMCIYRYTTFFTLLPQNTGAAGEVEESEENCIHSQTWSGTTAIKRSFSYSQEMCPVWGEAVCERGNMSVWQPLTKSSISDIETFSLSFLHYTWHHNHHCAQLLERWRHICMGTIDSMNLESALFSHFRSSSMSSENSFVLKSSLRSVWRSHIN